MKSTLKEPFDGGVFRVAAPFRQEMCATIGNWFGVSTMSTELFFVRGHVLAGLIVAVVFGLPDLAYAESPEEKGLAIAIEGDQRDRGFADSSVKLEMTLSREEREMM